MAYGGQGQYADWGAGAATTASIGIVTGGEVGPPNSPINHRDGIYAQSRMMGGMLEYTGSIEFLPTGENDATLIGYALRSGFTAPTLTALAIEGGHGSSHGWLHTGCYISTLELSQAVDGPLTASIAWQGTSGSRVASPSPQTLESGNPYEWFETSITIDAGTYDVREITVNVDNGLEPYSTLDSKSAASLRKPEGIKVGSEIVTVSLVMLSPADHSTLFDLDADDIDTDIDIVWTAGNNARTFTVTLSDLACTSNPMPFQSPDGLVVWNVELEAKHNTAGAITIADAAV